MYIVFILSHFAPFSLDSVPSFYPLHNILYNNKLSKCYNKIKTKYQVPFLLMQDWLLGTHNSVDIIWHTVPHPRS